MQTAIAKWGNSLALRIPRHLAAEAQLTEGSVVEVRAENGRLVIWTQKPSYRLADLMAEFKPEHRRSEAEVWGKPMGKEVW
jgi:antitoxin MazE